MQNSHNSYQPNKWVDVRQVENAEASELQANFQDANFLQLGQSLHRA